MAAVVRPVGTRPISITRTGAITRVVVGPRRVHTQTRRALPQLVAHRTVATMHHVVVVTTRTITTTVAQDGRRATAYRPTRVMQTQRARIRHRVVVGVIPTRTTTTATVVAMAAQAISSRAIRLHNGPTKARAAQVISSQAISNQASLRISRRAVVLASPATVPPRVVASQAEAAAVVVV